MTSIIKVDQIQNAAGTTGLTIDSDGVVSKSVVPAWRVSLTSDDLRTVTTDATVPFDLVDSVSDRCFLNGGVTISSGVITVPKDGIYQVNANIRVDAVGTGYVILSIRINNAGTSDKSEVYMIEGSPPSNYVTLNGHEVYKLEAGDNIRVTATSSSDTSWDVQSNSTFSGAMIG
jgi:hypothetical protein